MMFRGFYSKATNSLFALILHIVFNLPSLFSIIFCPPPPPAFYPYYSSPRKTLHLVLARSSWTLFHSALNRQTNWKKKTHLKPSPSRLTSDRDANSSCGPFSGCPSAGDRFGGAKVGTAQRRLVLQSHPPPPDDTRY